MTNTNTLKDYLLENMNTVKDLVQQINSWNGSLDHLEVYANDEEFFEMMYEGKLMEAVRATQYGDYSYSDDYVRINGYGNLDSCNEYDYLEELKDDINIIIEALLDEWTNLHLDAELEEMLEEMEEEEE